MYLIVGIFVSWNTAHVERTRDTRAQHVVHCVHRHTLFFRCKDNNMPIFASVFSSIVSIVCAMNVYYCTRTAAAGDDGFTLLADGNN